MVIKWGVRISLYNNREEKRNMAWGLQFTSLFISTKRTVGQYPGNTGVQDTICKI